jgi:hypothetical protein
MVRHGSGSDYWYVFWFVVAVSCRQTMNFDSLCEESANRIQEAEQDETRNPYQPPCFHDLP